MSDTFIKNTRQPKGDDLEVYEEIKKILDQGVLYHCGPVVSGIATKEYKFVAAGPTTSTREEPYQADVMKHFNIRGVIGKGGMGPKTLKGCEETPGVYLHAIGGAASFIAQSVQKVLGVYKMEFGVPEAFWVIQVKDFPAVVTMDAHGGSQHAVVDESSKKVLDEFLARPWALDVREGEVLRLSSPHGSIEVPVYVYGGLRRDVLAVPLGLGHTEFGQFATGRGANAHDLLGGEGETCLPYTGTRVTVTKTRGYVSLAKTEGNPRQLGRGIVETIPLGYAAQGMTLAQAHEAEGHGDHEINTEPELEAIAGFREAQIEKQKFGGYADQHPKWALAVDLSRCTGCSSMKQRS